MYMIYIYNIHNKKIHSGIRIIQINIKYKNVYKPLLFVN